MQLLTWPINTFLVSVSSVGCVMQKTTLWIMLKAFDLPFLSTFRWQFEFGFGVFRFIAPRYWIFYEIWIFIMMELVGGIFMGNLEFIKLGD
jgi:hypothetical protein